LTTVPRLKSTLGIIFGPIWWRPQNPEEEGGKGKGKGAEKKKVEEKEVEEKEVEEKRSR